MHFILDAEKNVAPATYQDWFAWWWVRESPIRVGLDLIETAAGPVSVSTVFLRVAVDASRLFETMARGGEWDIFEHCDTWAKAVAQHAAVVERVKESNLTVGDSSGNHN